MYAYYTNVYINTKKQEILYIVIVANWLSKNGMWNWDRPEKSKVVTPYNSSRIVSPLSFTHTILTNTELTTITLYNISRYLFVYCTLNE